VGQTRGKRAEAAAGRTTSSGTVRYRGYHTARANLYALAKMLRAINRPLSRQSLTFLGLSADVATTLQNGQPVSLAAYTSLAETARQKAGVEPEADDKRFSAVALYLRSSTVQLDAQILDSRLAEKGNSVNKAAQDFGINEKSLRNALDGKPLRLGTAETICRGLGCEIEELLLTFDSACRQTPPGCARLESEAEGLETFERRADSQEEERPASITDVSDLPEWVAPRLVGFDIVQVGQTRSDPADVVVEASFRDHVPVDEASICVLEASVEIGLDGCRRAKGADGAPTLCDLALTSDHADGIPTAGHRVIITPTPDAKAPMFDIRPGGEHDRLAGTATFSTDPAWFRVSLEQEASRATVKAEMVLHAYGLGLEEVSDDTNKDLVAKQIRKLRCTGGQGRLVVRCEELTIERPEEDRG